MPEREPPQVPVPSGSAPVRGWLASLLRLGAGSPSSESEAIALGGRRRRRWSQLFGRKQNRRVQARPPTIARRTSSPERRRRALHLALSIAGVLATGGALTAGLVALHRFFTRSHHFAIREVRFSPTAHVPVEALRARSGIAPGQNLFAIDLDAASQRIQADPWVASVRARRELPSVLAFDVKEREAACAVALGGLYLADGRGEVFKRARPDEAAGLPVVTGITRDGYVDDREASQALIREGLLALEAWRALPSRPAVGEIHVDAAAGITFYTVKDAIGVRLGHGDAASFAARLRRLDAVWRALADANERPRMILVDQQTHTDRVTVSLARPN